ARGVRRVTGPRCRWCAWSSCLPGEWDHVHPWDNPAPPVVTSPLRPAAPVALSTVLLAGLAVVAGELPGVGHGTEMGELVRVAHRTDRMDPAVGRVQGDRLHQVAVPVSGQCPGLPVDLLRLQRESHPAELRQHRGEHPYGVLHTHDRSGWCWGV